MDAHFLLDYLFELSSKVCMKTPIQAEENDVRICCGLSIMLVIVLQMRNYEGKNVLFPTTPAFPKGHMMLFLEEKEAKDQSTFQCQSNLANPQIFHWLLASSL